MMGWCAACSVCSGCVGCSAKCVTCAGCGGCVITPTPDIEVAITGVSVSVANVAGVGAAVGVVAW